MAGCNCNKVSGSLKYRVTWTNGHTPPTQDYPNMSAAQAAVTASGAPPGAVTIRAVNA